MWSCDVCEAQSNLYTSTMVSAYNFIAIRHKIHLTLTYIQDLYIGYSWYFVIMFILHGYSFIIAISFTMLVKISEQHEARYVVVRTNMMSYLSVSIQMTWGPTDTTICDLAFRSSVSVRLSIFMHFCCINKDLASGC